MDTLSRLVVMALSELPGVPERRSTSLHRIIAATAFAVLAVVAAASALGCAVAAFWIYLASAFGPLGAAIGSTAMLFFISVILVVLATVLLQDGQPPPPAKATLGDD